MADRVIGLDIGSNAVRAAEVELGARPVLRAFGQVSLPEGATANGEVVAPQAVGEAIRRLWHEVGFKTKIVRVGVASPRVVVRSVDFPDLPEAELEAALGYEAQEYIPIPIDEAMLDFQIVDSFTGAEGEALIQVLLAAAHKETVTNVLRAVEAGGLKASAVDLVPFALIRSLASESIVGGGQAEAILSIGAGVTNIVVHEGGLPTFVRTIATAGQDLTTGLAQELAILPQEAEALKRQIGYFDDEETERAEQILQSRVSALVSEVRGSFSFYSSQPEVSPIGRVLLTGGTSLLQGLDEKLATALGIPLELARPRDGLDVGKIGFAESELSLLDPYLAVAVGLALGGGKVAGRRINLLPGAERAGGETNRAPMLAMAAGGAALLLLLGLTTTNKSKSISAEREKLDAQTAKNTQLESEIAGLSGAEQTEQAAEQARNRIRTVLGTDVSWSDLLQDVARTIPGDVWLTNLKVLSTPPVAAAAGAPAPAPAPAAVPAPGDPAAAPTSPAPVVLTPITGTIEMSVTGLDFPSVAAWLQRMEQLPWSSDLWVASATRQAFGDRDVVVFGSTAKLTDAARSARIDRVLRGDQ